MTYRYPAPLKDGDTIAITAPSSGIGEFTARYEFVKEGLKDQGFKLIEGSCLYGSVNSVSGTPEERARDFMELWLNPEVAAIIPPWGGELLIQILEHLDLDLLSNSTPKWCMGYSDISLLLAVLTWKSKVVTAHGTNFLEMGASQVERLTKNSLDPLKSENGCEIVQKSAEKYLKGCPDFLASPRAPTEFTENVLWKSLSGKAEQFSGRVIGGCLDVLRCIVGTKYDGMDEFKKSADSEGAVLYLENCEMSEFEFQRALYQLKYAGWLDGLNGLVLGRDAGDFGESKRYTEILIDFFSSMSFPVIYDADIGHRQPNLTILNGSISRFFCQLDGTGEMTTIKK